MFLYEDQFRKVAGFLVANEDRSHGEKGLALPGTVVFVQTPILELPGRIWHLTYAVTTLHSLLTFNETRTQSKLRIRVNRSDNSGYVEVHCPFEDWFKDENEDVAVLPFIPRRSVDTESLSLHDLLGRQERQRYRPGDEIFMSGLYSYHPGTDVIEPILRFGHLSLVPREPVSMMIQPKGPLVKREAFLIEAQAWEGQSGSPVFAYEDNGRPGPLSMKMIGLVHGYTTVRLGKGASGPSVNAGIAIVVPAYRIVELLQRQDVMADQQRRAKSIQEQEDDWSAPTSGRPPCE